MSALARDVLGEVGIPCGGGSERSSEFRIKALGLHFQKLNDMIRSALKSGHKHLVLEGVNGQRYIGAGVQSDALIEIKGIPGNNLAALADGLTIHVRGNAQDGIANTMSEGLVVIEGSATDIVGYAMRGGQVFIRGNVGYRVGIHMKSFAEKQPLIVIGGTAGDFLGEYMAGGNLIVLGLNRQPGDELTGRFVGTGMHGGTIYVRGEVPSFRLGKEVAPVPLDSSDLSFLENAVTRFAGHFGLNGEEIMDRDFTKLVPVNRRPYGRLYAY